METMMGMEDAILSSSNVEYDTLDDWNRFYKSQSSIQPMYSRGESSVSVINDRYRKAVKSLRHTETLVLRETPISDAMQRIQQDARGIFACMVRYSYYNPRSAWNTAINEMREKVDKRVELETPESMWDAVNSLYILVVREGRGIAEIMSEESTAQFNITILAFERKMHRACSQLLRDNSMWDLYIPMSDHKMEMMPRRTIAESSSSSSYDCNSDEILT